MLAQTILDLAKIERAKYTKPGVRSKPICAIITHNVQFNFQKAGIDCKIMCGWYGDMGMHFWNEVDGKILDLSANQFPEITEDIVFDTYKNRPKYRDYYDTAENKWKLERLKKLVKHYPT